MMTTVMPDTKPRDVQVVEIAANTMVLRSRTWDRLKFEVEYSLQRGTTANAYLIQADKTALIDPPGESFTDIFIEELTNHVYLQRINYLILGHINPNRLATLKALLNVEVAPQLTIVCTRAGELALQSVFPGNSLRILVVNSEETLDLGQGHVLRFIPTPTPRYPDALCTYDEATRILYTDKLFCAHVCEDAIYDERWRTIEADRQHFFDAVHASQARQVGTALEKITPLPAKIYAPAHGPLVRYSLSRFVFDYREWCDRQQSKDFNVALLYASAYGSTGALAGAIAQGLVRAGAAVESINCEFADPADITAALERCDGFVFGSPTLAGHPPTQVQTALGLALSTAAKTKLAGVFGSFGWSGEAIDILESKLQDAGYQFGFETIRVKFKPTEETLQSCESAGAEFVQTLKKTKKIRTVRQPGAEVQSDRTEQAVARVTGSLCVVTTRYENQHQGMLTSWVSQATFNPPGLTIAIPKDQMGEAVAHPDSPLVLNILKEGRNLRRYFTKAMVAGEDRFAAIATHPSSNDCLILDDALAYLECTVENRMDCGDHWLIYALVNNGKVLESAGTTAIQHRKSASYF
jgi:flavorubredoxin/flavin reductase (DIM6/NTAB) family NADH-FMN oxidoreductase RutF